jgi:hypothetical protein
VYERSVESVLSWVSAENCLILLITEGEPSDRLRLVALTYQLVKTAVPHSCASPNIHFSNAVVTVS